MNHLISRWPVNRSHLVFGAALAVLIVLVIAPLAQLLIKSFQHPETGALTVLNYVEALNNEWRLLAIWHSVLLGSTVACVCMIVGAPIAWAVSQTNMPAKPLISLLVLTSFITPDYLNAISWILLAGPNAGWLNRGVMALTGWDSGIFNIYTFWGLAFVVSISALPYVFIFTTAALSAVGSDMTDAARILGATVTQTTLRVTLPLVLPAILAGGVITFLEAIASFGTPALIGLPARFTVVSTQLWAFFSFPIKLQAACAYAIPLVLLTVILFWLQRWMTRRQSYVVQTGKSAPAKQIDLGAYRWPLSAFLLAVLFALVVLPYLTLISASLSKAWGLGPTWDNLTLNNFKMLIERPTIKTAIANTFFYALAAAMISVSLGSLIAYGALRRMIPFRQFFSVVCLTPFVIPGMVLAIGFYAAYAPPPLSLYGTSAIIIFAFTTRFLPIAFASASAAIRTIHPDMEDQVRNLGGDRVAALRYVVLPLLKHSILGAGILVFIPALGELSTALFLSVEDTQTLSVTIFHLNEGGNRSAFELVSALGVVLFLSTTFFVACGIKLFGSNFILRSQSS